MTTFKNKKSKILGSDNHSASLTGSDGHSASLSGSVTHSNPQEIGTIAPVGRYTTAVYGEPMPNPPSSIIIATQSVTITHPNNKVIVSFRAYRDDAGNHPVTVRLLDNNNNTLQSTSVPSGGGNGTLSFQQTLTNLSTGTHTFKVDVLAQSGGNPSVTYLRVSTTSQDDAWSVKIPRQFRIILSEYADSHTANLTGTDNHSASLTGTNDQTTRSSGIIK